MLSISCQSGSATKKNIKASASGECPGMRGNSTHHALLYCFSLDSDAAFYESSAIIFKTLFML